MYFSFLMGHVYSIFDITLTIDKYVFELKQLFKFN